MNLKNVFYINWHDEGVLKNVTISQFDTLLDHAVKKGHALECKTKRSEYSKNAYFTERVGYWRHLYCREKGEFIHYLCHAIDDSVNLRAIKTGKIENTGRKCAQIEKTLFLSFNGVSERRAFGYSDYAINKCVPKQLYYIDDRFVGKYMQCVSKADFSSHYPAAMCGRMPTWKDHLQINGRVDPNPDYPFAFYIKSGHIAEHNVLDTHEWLDYDINSRLFGNNFTYCEDNDEITILCKKSDYTFDSTVEFLYSEKTAGNDIDNVPAKKILNSSIGYKHLNNPKNTSNRFYHIAAVTLARANQKMCDYYHLYSRQILQIVVDSLIYVGNKPIGDNVKTLGGLVQEYTGQRFIMRGINQYMFFDQQDHCLEKRHSGLNKNIFSSVPDDIIRWSK